MMRLDIQSQSRAVVILAVHGVVAGANVEVLAAEGQRHLQVAQYLVLILDGVQFIDEAGLALLRRWSGKRLQLRGGSVFVRQLLAVAGLLAVADG